MSDELLLIGSIPLDTAQDVFESFGATLGPYLSAIPDGEVGLRKHWISRVHYQVFALHPDLEVLQQPRPDHGVERLNPHNTSDAWQFKVKDGVHQIRFGEPGWRLGFARDAINSYFMFRTLREQGVLAEHLRFQVSMPMVSSAAPSRIFPVPGDVDVVRRGYEEALRTELETIVSRIPAHDLAIQWDCATELQEAYGTTPNVSPQTLIEHNIEPVRRLSPLIPEESLLGYHLCFGTLGGWPRFEPNDLGGAVTLANALIENSGRRVNWMHIPILDRHDDAFFSPLGALRQQETRVYLGLIHNMARFQTRAETARRYCPDFGMAAYCGFGRVPPDEMPQILHEHQQAINL